MVFIILIPAVVAMIVSSLFWLVFGRPEKGPPGPPGPMGPRGLMGAPGQDSRITWRDPATGKFVKGVRPKLVDETAP